MPKHTTTSKKNKREVAEPAPRTYPFEIDGRTSDDPHADRWVYTDNDNGTEIRGGKNCFSCDEWLERGGPFSYTGPVRSAAKLAAVDAAIAKATA